MFVLIAVFFISLYLIRSKFYLVKPKLIPNYKYLAILKSLAEKNMYANEVPVSAILVYQGEIIGKGKNSMVQENKISGHAEINALNDAFLKFGNEFYKLDKSKMKLYTTLEPCPMCKGALVQHGITKVFFDEPKSLTNTWKLGLKSIIYELKKRRISSNGLQKDLFNKHPSYIKHNKLN